MTTDEINPLVLKKAEQLRRERENILSLPPDKAIDSINSSSQPVALVHSFNEQDLYLLVQSIGPEDAVSILSMASIKQWEYLMDIETWQIDTIDMVSMTRWLNLLLKSDPKRFVRWVLTEKADLIAYYLQKHIEVMVREHDEDPSTFPDDFTTIDDMVYFRVKDIAAPPEVLKDLQENRDEFLTRFLNNLTDYDHVIFVQVMQNLSGVLPAETEEEEYRLRNVRLSEKGFETYDMAVGIYQPLAVDQLAQRQTKYLDDGDPGVLQLPVPLLSTSMLGSHYLFAKTLQHIREPGHLFQIQSEFAGLCNRVISADHKKIQERDDLKKVVDKVSGYLSIGLERISAQSDSSKQVDPVVQGAGWILRYPLIDIFRTGYANGLALKWRAEKWRRTSWFNQQHLALNFWGEEWVGVLGGLLIKKPLFFDNYKTGAIYREFETLEDIDWTRTVLDQIIQFDHIFSLMDFKIGNFEDALLSYKNLILTLWARSYLNLAYPQKLVGYENLVLGIDELKQFFKELLPDMGKSESPSKIPMEMKTSMLNYIRQQTGPELEDISSELSRAFNDLFDEIEGEYGNIKLSNLDPRYIYLFLVRT